jgi:putative salt-induced outer membrane protein YdiY
MRKTILLFCLTIKMHILAQIVNIENRRIYDDTAGWSGSIDASGSITQNANVFYNLNFRPRVQFKTRKNYFLFLTDFNYTGSEGETFANAGMSHFRYAMRIKESAWKWESYTQVQYNQLLNQKLRTLLGSGIRWKFLDKNNKRVFVGSSLFYEYEVLQKDSIIQTSLRNSNYLAWFLKIGKNVNFTGTIYFQPAFSKPEDWRLSGNAALNYSIGKHMDLRFEYTLFHDQFPPIAVRKTVYNSSFGIRFRLNE